MNKKYTQAQINNKKKYYREQRINPTGKFTEFLVRTYFIINKFCNDSKSKMCLSYRINKHTLVSYLYEGFYNNNKSNHSTCTVDECVKELDKMKYIRYIKNELDNRWYVKIEKPLDFLLEGEESIYIEKYKNIPI